MDFFMGDRHHDSQDLHSRRVSEVLEWNLNLYRDSRNELKARWDNRPAKTYPSSLLYFQAVLDGLNAVLSGLHLLLGDGKLCLSLLGSLDRIGGSLLRLSVENACLN